MLLVSNFSKVYLHSSGRSQRGQIPVHRLALKTAFHSLPAPSPTFCMASHYTLINNLGKVWGSSHLCGKGLGVSQLIHCLAPATIINSSYSSKTHTTSPVEKHESFSRMGPVINIRRSCLTLFPHSFLLSKTFFCKYTGEAEKKRKSNNSFTASQYANVPRIFVWG